MRLTMLPCLLSLLLLPGIGAGCAGKPEGPPPPPLVPFSGVVQLNGKPAVLAQVRFEPQGQTRGFGATATTDGEGRFELTSQGGQKGVPEGEYKVTISSFFLGEGYEPTPEEQEKIKAMGTPTPIPQQYSDMETTPLTITVGPQGGTQSFDLK